MCLVKLASPGPAFYRQRRVGYRGKQFMIFKFRTMRVNAETRTHEEYLEQLIVNDAPMTKLDALDPRLIPGGRFLRAAGLDELPQIFNVIRGEMSLVGPRPCTVIEFQSYRPEQRERVNAPPGITGFWQVNGKNKTTFKEMIAMDIFYAKNMSLSLDLAIIWKTISVIVRQALESSAPPGQRRNEAGERRAGSRTRWGCHFELRRVSPADMKRANLARRHRMRLLGAESHSQLHQLSNCSVRGMCDVNEERLKHLGALYSSVPDLH